MTKIIAKIAEQIEPLAIALDKLTPLERNPRRNDVEKIAESYTTFGQLKPIVVDDTYRILSGNHQYAAAKSLGWTHIAAVVASELDEAQGKKFALADNRLSELGYFDHQELIEALKDLDDLTATGYDQEYLDGLVALYSTPTLDELADDHPLDSKDHDTLSWPWVRLQVPKHVYAIFQDLMDAAAGDTEAERFETLMRRIT